MLRNKNMRQFIFLGLFVCVLSPLSYAEEVVFKNKTDVLVGQYLEPSNNKKAKAVILFVHGDGPMSYDAEGYYNFIWNALRAKGYAIFSWNKPNVGDSKGNWLNQSMKNRQDEVIAAVIVIQERYNFTAENTGLLGFSQAGWVIPHLANDSNNIGFIIGIGFARNWIDQGEYYTKVKHTLRGENKKEIDKAILDYKESIDFLKTSPSYREYLKSKDPNPMSKDRFGFALKNLNSDATKDYEGIKIPSLFLWGVNDLNVKAIEEFNFFKNRKNKFVTTKLISNANHGMLNSNLFKEQKIGLRDWIKIIWYEEEAFAPRFLSTLIFWLEKRQSYTKNESN
jgi:pimeloyl-ACP methyl ester carboxylesterase